MAVGLIEMKGLAGTWADACQALAVPDRHQAFEDVVAHYRGPRRAHHDVGHLVDVVTGVVDLAAAEGLDRVGRAVAVFAAFFHDAVQEPWAPDNEYRSGELARSVLYDCGMTRPHIDRVVRAVNATAAHQSDDLEAQVLIDADLAILGADPDRYARYVAGVRREHDHLSHEEFTRGRRLVLENLLARPTIYETSTQRRRLEERARANMRAELARLAGSRD